MSIKIGKWTIRPEIEKPIYWLHLVIIVLIVYFLINQFLTPMEITIKSVIIGTIIVGIADICAHTILKLD